MATNQQGTSLDAIASLLKLFQGVNETQTQTVSGGAETTTRTEGKEISQQALAGLLQQALESNTGLASVTQGQKSAGLYDSSTNKLLTNDLLSRLTTNLAAQTAKTTSSQTSSISAPKVMTTNKQTGGMSSANGDTLSKLMLGYTAANKMGLIGDQYDEKGNVKEGLLSALLKGGLKKGKSLYDQSQAVSPAIDSMASADSLMNGVLGFDQPLFSGGGAISQTVSDPSFLTQALPSTGFDIMPAAASFQTTDGMPMDFTSSAAEVSAPADFSGVQAAADAVPAGEWTAFDDAAAEYANWSSNLQATADAQDWAAWDDAVSEWSNFQKASSTGDAVNTVGEAAPVSQYISTGADVTAASSLANSADVAAASELTGGEQSLEALSQILAGEDTVQAASAVADTAAASEIATGAGSTLGYVAPVLNAWQASQTDGDYREAVGGAILNYFGFGWATPIVDAIAQPALDEAMQRGTESMGTLGAVLADPIGAPLSGQYEVKDLVTATLDPANLLGGNEGGSVGSTVALGVDPIGAALGDAVDNTPFDVVSEGVNKIDSALSPGRVVCTELALSGHISMDKYSAVIAPEVTLKGRVLLGYHVLGVPAVRAMRENPKLVRRMLPYVNAYLDHKLGKHNWRGWLIKTIGEPLCWCLSFFNRDPDYYQVLYPYRRNRNV